MPGSSTCCNKRNRQGCQRTTTTKGREGRGGMGCGRSFVSPPHAHSRARCGEGNNRSCMERGVGGRREEGDLGWGGDFLYREESRIPPSSSPDPEEKCNKSLTHPRGPSGLKLLSLRAPSSRPVLSLPFSPGSSPGPAQPLPLPAAAAGKAQRSAERDGAGGTPHYCPLAGSAAAATAGVRAAQSRRD